MKKHLLLLLITILSFNSYSQTTFEKGYYINNSEQKIDCMIKNFDWKNNPTDFEYKLSENDETKNTDIKLVKEFGIYNNSKYIRTLVKIDKSSDNINHLSSDRNPVFVEEQLFLKVLIEGKSNLFYYEKGDLKRFFYNKDNASIEQLVFKRYMIHNNLDGGVSVNSLFKEQLRKDLYCPAIEMKTFKYLDYNKSSLVKLFIEYNNCNNVGSINYERKIKRDLFNLSLRPRFNNSSLSINNVVDDSRDTDFGNKSGFGFGIEFEYILPFNNNKWAIVIESAFQSFKAEKTTDVNDLSGGKQITTVEYNSIEIPISLRHSFFLNKNSKIFINASYIINLSSKSLAEFKRANNSIVTSLDVESENNLAFGLGYSFKNRYSLEMRYQTNREILANYRYWNSNYKTTSIILGYSLF